MSHIGRAPLDAAAHDGTMRTFIAEDDSPHSARWDRQRRKFLYGNGYEVQPRIVAYLAHFPGAAPTEERTA